MAALLDSDEPAAIEVVQADAGSDLAIVCDHAGRALPRALGSLGLTESQLESHIAWDIGAAGVARGLARALDARLFLQRYSRLVIDCNRPLHAPDSIAHQSGGIEIAGNRDLTPTQIEQRRQSIFHPYHERIRASFEARPPALLVSMHTFTPELFGVRRPFHAGVLYERDRRLAAPLLALLRQEPDLVVGDNEPYAASSATDYAIIQYGELRGIPYVEFEVRQDLVSDAQGQALWAARLARLLQAARLRAGV